MKRRIGVSTLSVILPTVLIMLSLSLLGCQSRGLGPSLTPAESLTKPTESALAEATEAGKPLSEAETTANGLQDSPAKSKLITALARVSAWYNSNLEAWKQSVASAKEVDKAIKQRDAKIASLEKSLVEATKSDPVKGWLSFIGVIAILAGGAILIASFTVTALYAMPWVRPLGAGVLAFGLLVSTLVRFMTAIYWISAGCIVAALVGGAIYLITHRKIIKGRLEKAAKAAKSPIIPVTPPN